MEGVRIDVYSDLACPWCYVGKRRLDTALKQLQKEPSSQPVTVRWHPYIIDRNTAPNGENYEDYNIRRWGSDHWTFSLRNNSRRDGLEFKNWQTWPNSLHGHRLVQYAGKKQGAEGQNRAKDILFRMVYEDGKNISNVQCVTEAAKELGLEDAEAYLRSDEDVDVILSEDSQAKSSLKISGVPYFIIRNEAKESRPITLSGAQPPTTFIDAVHALCEQND